MKGRDWLMTQDWSDAEIELALDTAATLKKEFKSGITSLHLPHKTIFLIFFDKSTRTRNSFEAGITQLGRPCAFHRFGNFADRPRRKPEGHGHYSFRLRARHRHPP